MANWFTIGAEYTRDDVAEAIGMPRERRGGSWDTGYDEWAGQVFIFANVGVAGRTGHDYANRWQDKDFVWFGKTRARRGQPQIDRIISNTVPVHIFWRGKDRSPFTYGGVARAIEASDDTPIRVLWAFDSDATPEIVDPPVDAGHSLRWRRGPPPSSGQTLVSRADGPTVVYVLKLVGNPQGLRAVAEGHAIIKVGISNEVDRRLRELNVGFPPGSSVSWTCIQHRVLSTALEAFALEGERLEQLRRDGHWIGGEFAIVPENIIESLLD